MVLVSIQEHFSHGKHLVMNDIVIILIIYETYLFIY